MVQLSTKFLIAVSVAAVHVHGLPFTKRIAQTIADSTTKWVAACETAGGGSQCNTVSVNAFETLLIAAGVCDQQNAADSMVDLAKQLNNNQDMITLAQIFVQQPRNTPNSLAVPYCQQAPNNTELNGLYQCQFQSANQNQFVGGLAVGAAGTIPFGLSAPLSPLGSCPANPSGPITDSAQLVDITQNPGTGTTSTNTGSNAASATATGTASAVSASASATGDDGDDTDDNSCGAASATGGEAIATSVATSAAASSTASTSSSGFKLSNGQAAQKLNAQFASLTAGSSCTSGTDACVGGAFAQCVDGAYVTQSCGTGVSCFALPLVNSPGTSITCSTEADATSRIAATGATGGLTGSN